MSTYTEVEPVGPQEHGDVGGDNQLSGAWGRRFLRDDTTGDGEYAMVTVTFYTESDPNDGDRVLLTRQVEYMLCRDPQDPGGTEVWSDLRYDDIPVGGTPDERTAQVACRSFDPAAVTWDGEVLTDGATHPVREAVAANVHQELITVFWNPHTARWRVDVRASVDADWSTFDGEDGELASLLDTAWVVATGG